MFEQQRFCGFRVAPTVQNHERDPMVKVKHPENVGVLVLYRLNVTTTMSIYLVTQLLEIYNKNFLITSFQTFSIWVYTGS